MPQEPENASDSGAFSFLPGMSRETLRAQIQGHEFLVARNLRKARRPPNEWTAGFLYAVHRDIFGKHFPGEAGRNRTGEANYGVQAAPAPEQLDGLMQQLLGSVVAHLCEIVVEPDLDQRFERIFGFAAMDHGEMIRIHPFIDGNGRWARIITICFLRDCGLTTGTIFRFSEKTAYIAALDRWNDKRAWGDLANELLRGYQASMKLRA